MEALCFIFSVLVELPECLSGVSCQGPSALPGFAKALGHTQFVPNLNSDLFLFGLCSLQQIGYVLARQLGISAASVTFNCPHTRSNLSRGWLKAFLRLLW